MVKNLPAMQETWVRSLGQGDPLEKEMDTHSTNLAWRIPWTEEPCGVAKSQTWLSNWHLHFGRPQWAQHSHRRRGQEQQGMSLFRFLRKQPLFDHLGQWICNNREKRPNYLSKNHETKLRSKVGITTKWRIPCCFICQSQMLSIYGTLSKRLFIWRCQCPRL